MITLLCTLVEATSWTPELLPRTAEMEARYDNADNDPRGPWTSGDISARNYYSEGVYPVTCPSGRVVEGPPPGTYWRFSKEKFREVNRDGRIWWGKDGNGTPRLKRFLSEVKQGRVPQTLWPYSEVGHTQDAKKELLEQVRFEQTDNVLDTVKPVALVRRMLQLATRPVEGDIVLDFFAGGGSTGHAVIAQNAEDDGNRSFILVQLPEPLPRPETVLKTIADIAKERIRRAVEQIDAGKAAGLDLEHGRDQDRGFRVFKLGESNFSEWDAGLDHDPEALEKQLELHIDHIREGRGAQDILYELLLKSGFPLTTPVEKKTVAGWTVYAVAGGALVICLEHELTLELIRAIAAMKPERVVCLDEGFAGNDQLKANAVQTFRTKGVTSFKTV